MQVRLLEYEEDGHSFHAKGMWITYRHHKHDDGSVGTESIVGPVW